MLVGHDEMDQQKSRKDIEKSISLYCEMLEQAEKYKKLAELAKRDELETIKHSVSYIKLDWALPNAMKWVSMRSGKLDGRRKYEEKESFDYLTSTIVSELTGKPIEITNIYSHSYMGKTYIVEFECDSRKFKLQIPSMKDFNMDALSYGDFGQLSISHIKSEHDSKYICASYVEEEIKKDFQKFLMASETDGEYFD